MIKHLALFHKTQQLNSKMTTFLTNIIEAGLVFEKAVATYVQKGVTRTFLTHKQKILGYDRHLH